jgi:hypothetical protein
MAIIELLGLVFVILKLTGVIGWSWWWVCSPFIIAFAYGFILSMIAIGSGISQGLTMDEIRANIHKSIMSKKM